MAGQVIRSGGQLVAGRGTLQQQSQSGRRLLRHHTIPQRLQLLVTGQTRHLSDMTGR